MENNQEISRISEDIQTKKIQLEIEELRGKIIDQKKIKIWDNYIKSIIPVIVTLTIGIWGSILTNNYNRAQLENTNRKYDFDSAIACTQLENTRTQLEIAIQKNLADKELAQTQLDILKRKNEAEKLVAITQLEVSKNKNESDKTIAQINASLSFEKLLSEISINNPDLENQVKTVIAPALPPETSFNIALKELPENPIVLEVLIRTYKNEKWKYLVPYAEFLPPRYSHSKNLPEAKPYLFEFLKQRLLLKEFYDFLISPQYKSINRINALINYFDFIYEAEELSHNPSKAKELEYEIKTTIDKSIDILLKSDLASAASIVFDKYQSHQIYSELAAKFYWEKFDVSIGQTPFDDSIDQYIYEKRFHIENIYSEKQIELPIVNILSNSLYKKLLKLNYILFDVERIGIILYSYCETQPRGNKNPFTPYLRSYQSYQLLKKVLQSLNTEKRRLDFSFYLGSLAGDILFRNISQNKEIGGLFGNLIIKWYKNNWRPSWGIPKFISNIIEMYPELKPQIDKRWGISFY